MTKYSFILLRGDKDNFLSGLRSLGVVDIVRGSRPVDEKSEDLAAEIDGLRSELRIVESGTDDRLRSLQAKVSSCRTTLEDVRVWGSFDRDKLSSMGLTPRFFSVKKKDFESNWVEDYPLLVVEENGDRVWFVLFSDDEFPVVEVPAPCVTLSEAQSSLDEAIFCCREYESELLSRREELPLLRSRIDALQRDFSAYLASLKMSSAADGSLCVFEGFAPSSEDSRLAAEFDSLDCIWFCEPARSEDNPPVKLRNNRFSKMFEVLTGMYGMPVYDEFDPTAILSVFFLLFFAMCMGDAGYGLILILFGIAVNRKWVRIDMFKNIGSLISVLGVGTLVVGFFLGTFFGVPLAELPWIPDSMKKCFLNGKIAGYDMQMVLALAVGVFHICLAMCLKAACNVRRFGLKSNLSTCGWTLLIVGGVIIAALSLMNVLSQTSLKILVIALACVSALGIFIFNKPGRNPLLNIGAGIWDSYQMATGILGDVLSYIRLYALGLAGGMLGSAFNDLGTMVLGADPTWQWVPFVLILLVGHVLNLLMSCLGAFVHPLRLTFVEFFKNSGFEGKGLKYNPLT